MFQSFDTIADPALGAPRVARLREVVSAAKLDAILVPRADEHQGEYVPASAERLRAGSHYWSPRRRTTMGCHVTLV